MTRPAYTVIFADTVKPFAVDDNLMRVFLAGVEAVGRPVFDGDHAAGFTRIFADYAYGCGAITGDPRLSLIVDTADEGNEDDSGCFISVRIGNRVTGEHTPMLAADEWIDLGSLLAGETSEQTRIVPALSAVATAANNVLRAAQRNTTSND